MIASTYKRSLLAVLLSLSIGVSARAATPIYQETFDSSSVGSGGTNWVIVNTISVTGAAYGFVGKTTTATASSAPSNQTNNLYAYAQNNTAAPNNNTTTVDYFFRTSNTLASAALFTSLVPSNNASMVASWQSTTGGPMTDGTNTMKYYLTVQVGGTWYAAATNGSTGYAGSTTPAVTYSLDLLNANWYAVTYSQGSSLSLNLAASTVSSSTLFSGGQQITGLGWYVKDLPGATGGGTVDYRTIRFDNLVVNIPEPTRATLFALAFTAVFFRRNRVK